MSRLRDYLCRIFLIPSLRFFRDHIFAGADHHKCRRWAKKADAFLGKSIGAAQTTAIELDHCSATWLDVAESSADRVILYLHGGAFVMETPITHMALLAKFCRGTRARGLMVNYRLAPENPYPAAVDDCLDAYRHLLACGFSPASIVIAGDSAGGNLTLATLLRCRDIGLPLPVAAVALSPLTDATFSGESIHRNAGLDPMFTPALLEEIAPQYFSKEGQRLEPYASPLFADLRGMPPILIFVGSNELLLDDSVRFASRCSSVTLRVWQNMPHVFVAFPFLAEAKLAVCDICAFVNLHVATGPSKAMPVSVDLTVTPSLRAGAML